MTRWLCNDSREYEIKILDSSWELLDVQIREESEMTWGELDGQKLQFLSIFRPAARYVYFHYCVQVLRAVWQRNSAGRASEATAILEKETGKPFWGTTGRYISRGMLLALAEELGHDYRSLLNGATFSPIESSPDSTLLEVASRQVKSRRPCLNGYVFLDYDSEAEDADDEGEDDGCYSH